jgi:hypothetical protein
MAVAEWQEGLAEESGKMASMHGRLVNGNVRRIEVNAGAHETAGKNGSSMVKGGGKTGRGRRGKTKGKIVSA